MESYIDYASREGHFRKYRFIFVSETILPYHPAIGNDWKVHHISTDMANQPGCRARTLADKSEEIATRMHDFFGRVL